MYILVYVFFNRFCRITAFFSQLFDGKYSDILNLLVQRVGLLYYLYYLCIV